MISTIITIGDKITLTKVYNMDEINIEKKQYVSSILDINQDEFMYIGMPSYNGQIITLHIGDHYQLCVYTKRGLYQCDGVVIDRYKEGTLYIAIIRILSGLVKQQRRQFYRLEKIMDISHCLYEEEASPDEPVLVQWEKAIMTDISGGGARFNSNNRFEAGRIVLLKVVLPLQAGNQEFILKARVISSQILINRIGSYETRVEFSEIERSQREEIIRYVFEEERKQRRREKGLV